MLSVITYYLIEKNVKKQKSFQVVFVITVLLISIGLLGSWVSMKNGLEERFSNLSESIKVQGEVGESQWEKFYQSSECNNLFGKYNYCLIEKPSKNPTMLLLGDSHANHLYPGFIQSDELSKENILNLGVSLCPPVYDIPNENCTNLMNKALEIGIKDQNIKTIVLTYRNIISFTPLKKKGLTNWIKNTLNNEDIETNFSKNLRITLGKLVESNKRIIYVLDIPRPDFNPNVCLNRPWRIGGQGNTGNCSISKDQHIQNNKNFIDLITPILKEFPQIEIWDPTDAICDDSECYVIKNNLLLYRDDNHLTLEGSKMVVDFLISNSKIKK